MRTANIIKLICWIVVAALLIGILIVCMRTGTIRNIFYNLPVLSINPGDNWSVSSGESDSAVSADGSYAVSADGIQRINVNWVSGSIAVTPYSGTEICFNETANRTITDELALNYSVSGNSLNIDFFKETTGFSPRNITKQLELLVPESVAAALDEVEIYSVSADIAVSGVSSRSMELVSTSGKIGLDGCEATEISITTTSGAIVATECVCNKLDTEGVSGELVYSGSASDIRSDAISGSVSFALNTRPDKMNVNTVSGSISLTMPDNDGFRVQVDKISGSVSCDFPTISENDYRVYGNGEAVYSFDTVSGSIRIEKAE